MSSIIGHFSLQNIMKNIGKACVSMQPHWSSVPPSRSLVVFSTPSRMNSLNQHKHSSQFSCFYVIRGMRTIDCSKLHLEKLGEMSIHSAYWLYSANESLKEEYNMDWNEFNAMDFPKDSINFEFQQVWRLKIFPTQNPKVEKDSSKLLSASPFAEMTIKSAYHFYRINTFLQAKYGMDWNEFNSMDIPKDSFLFWHRCLWRSKIEPTQKPQLQKLFEEHMMLAYPDCFQKNKEHLIFEEIFDDSDEDYVDENIVFSKKPAIEN